MKETLNSHKFYAVWEYKREENDLNEASKNGLQLIKGGCFHSTFRRDHSRRYIYQLDYCTKIPDMDRYIECFRDAGWEYINSTFNGWHYFRRPYSPDLDPEDAKIYTDRESMFEMENRWFARIRAASVIFLLMGLVYVGITLLHGFPVAAEQIPLLLESIIFLLLSATFFLAWRSVSQTRRGERAGFVPPTQILFPVVLLLLLIGCVMIIFL